MNILVIGNGFNLAHGFKDIFYSIPNCEMADTVFYDIPTELAKNLESYMKK